MASDEYAILSQSIFWLEFILSLKFPSFKMRLLTQILLVQKWLIILFVTLNHQSCFHQIFPRNFLSFSTWKRKKKYWSTTVYLSLLDPWKVCFLFQLVKLRKIRGKKWGKQNQWFGGLMSRTRFKLSLPHVNNQSNFFTNFFVVFNRSSRRKRGMASNPIFIIPGFFLHFPNELCYGYLRFEGNGKIPSNLR